MAQDFEIPVEPLRTDEDDDDDDDFNFRIRNKGEIQREYITGYDRNEVVVVLGRRKDVVHGFMDGSTKRPCTIVVFDWEVQKRHLEKRFKHVQIKVLFASEGHKGDAFYDPIVREMAPQGSYFMLHTVQKVEEKKGGEVSAQAGPPAGGSAGAKITYELTTSTDRNDYIRVNGYPRVDNSRGGARNKPNAVEWNLFENVTQRSGVPTLVRTAVLLERHEGDDTQFTATVSVKEKVDSATDVVRKVKEIAGRIPKDDPVIFDPNTPPTTTKFGKHNLESVKLHDLCTFSSHVGTEIQTSGSGPAAATPKAEGAGTGGPSA
jgi:hypothetical protein